MPNTVHGPYNPTTCINGVTPLNATLGNAMQTQSAIALASFNPDLLTAFVESGITCTKDGTNANQLDIASGKAYLVMSDGTVARIDVVADNTHTTVTPSTTYHLYLQPDGTWYWNTANTPAAGSLFIAQVTTDGSGNILAVTDERPLNPSLLPDLAGELVLPALAPIASVGGQASVGGFGVPVIVAQALDTHVTSTSSAILVTYTAPANAFYLVMATFTWANPTNSNVTLFTQFEDVNMTGLSTEYFIRNDTITAINAMSFIAPGRSLVVCVPMTIYVNAGTVFHVIYQDASGTPNDFVSVMICRLA